MEIRCPACNKIIVHSETECSRCECYVAPLFQILRKAAEELQHGQRLLKSGFGDEAQVHAELSWNLRRSKESARCAFFASLLGKKYEATSYWYKILHERYSENKKSFPAIE